MPNFSRSDAQVTLSSEQPTVNVESKKARMETVKKKRSQKFSDEDAMALFNHGEDILDISPDNTKDAWEAWASKFDVSGGNLIS